MGFFERQFGAGMVLRGGANLNAVVADFYFNNINLREDVPTDGGPAIWVDPAAAARIEECVWRNNTPATEGNVATPINSTVLTTALAVEAFAEQVFADDSLAAVVETFSNEKLQPRTLDEVAGDSRFLNNDTEFFQRNSPTAVLEDTAAQAPLTPVRRSTGETCCASAAERHSTCSRRSRAAVRCGARVTLGRECKHVERCERLLRCRALRLLVHRPHPARQRSARPAPPSHRPTATTATTA